MNLPVRELFKLWLLYAAPTYFSTNIIVVAANEFSLNNYPDIIRLGVPIIAYHIASLIWLKLALEIQFPTISTLYSITLPTNSESRWYVGLLSWKNAILIWYSFWCVQLCYPHLSLPVLLLLRRTLLWEAHLLPIRTHFL